MEQTRQINQDSNDLTVILTTNSTSITFPTKTVLIRDWRRANGNVQFNFDHQLLGPLKIEICWRSEFPSNIGILARKLSRFSRDYLINRVSDIRNRGVPWGSCLLKSVDGNKNYVNVMLTGNGISVNTNYTVI